MRPTDSLKRLTGQVTRIGVSKLALGLAVFLCLLALLLPMWSYTELQGGPRSAHVFGWTTETTEEFDADGWERTVINPYAHPDYDHPFIASTISASYVLTIVFLIALVAVIVLLMMPRMATIGPLAKLVVCVLVVGIGFLALLYPVLVLPGGLAADMGTIPIGGSYWGSATGPIATYTWGAGLGWWLLLMAVLAGSLGSALPYLRAVRTLGPSRPQTWNPRT